MPFFEYKAEILLNKLDVTRRKKKRTELKKQQPYGGKKKQSSKETFLKAISPSLSLSLSHFILYIISTLKILNQNSRFSLCFLSSFRRDFLQNFPGGITLNIHFFSTNISNFFNLLFFISVTGSIAGTFLLLLGFCFLLR